MAKGGFYEGSYYAMDSYSADEVNNRQKKRDQKDGIEERQARESDEMQSKAFLHGDRGKVGWFGGVIGTKSRRIQSCGHVLSGVKDQFVNENAPSYATKPPNQNSTKA